MTDYIYNELRSRGYTVDVGVVETAAGVITPVTNLFNATKTGGVAISFDFDAESVRSQEML